MKGKQSHSNHFAGIQERVLSNASLHSAWNGAHSVEEKAHLANNFAMYVIHFLSQKPPNDTLNEGTNAITEL